MLKSAYYITYGVHVLYILFLISIPILFPVFYVHHRILAAGIIFGALASNLLFLAFTEYNCPLTLIQRSIEKKIKPGIQKPKDFLVELSNRLRLPSRAVWAFMVGVVIFDLLVLL